MKYYTIKASLNSHWSAHNMLREIILYFIVIVIVIAIVIVIFIVIITIVIIIITIIIINEKMHRKSRLITWKLQCCKYICIFTAKNKGY